MGGHINYYYEGHFFPVQSSAIYGHAMDMRKQRQHSRNVWYGGVTNGRLRHKQVAAAYSEDTPCAHAWCCVLLLCARVVALCSLHVVCCLPSAIFAEKQEKLRTEQTSSPNLAYVHGDRGCGNPNPGDGSGNHGAIHRHAQAVQHSSNMWCGRVTNDRLPHNNSPQHSADTP